MSKDTDDPLVNIINEYVAAAPLLSLHDNNTKYSEKKYIVTNIQF